MLFRLQPQREPENSEVSKGKVYFETDTVASFA